MTDKLAQNQKPYCSAELPPRKQTPIRIENVRYKTCDTQICSISITWELAEM